jgi:hypothetical protein
MLYYRRTKEKAASILMRLVDDYMLKALYRSHLFE